MTETSNRPKIGLAMAGASSRSVFYIGFLEVLKEENFPIDYIAAMSGGAVVAASYACGTLPELKKIALELNKEIIFSLIERSKSNGGLYHLEKAEHYIRSFTNHLRFEDVTPRLGFVTTDIVSGEIVTLEIGDIAKAVCASCTLPWIFEPVPWGNKLLVDGGILSVVPGPIARQAGMDIVIGLHLRNTMHIFSSWQILLRRVVKRVKRMLLIDHASLLWQRTVSAINNSDFFGGYSDLIDEQLVAARPGLFAVLGRSLDLAIKAQQQEDPTKTDFGCDLVIRPDITIPFWKKYLYRHFTDFTKVTDLYELGRKTAHEQLPAMRALIEKYEQSSQLKK